jgi:hypothetical protein
MMNRLRQFLILFSVILLTGCASPLVKYATVTDPDKNGATKFQFADSVIRFEYPKEGEGVAAATNYNKMTITSIPVVHSSMTYSIDGTSWYENWGVETAIATKHRNDTLLLQEVGSTVSDKRIETIDALAKVATSAIALFGAAAPLPADTETNKPHYQAPDGLSVSTLFKKGAEQKCTEEVNGEEEMITCKNLELTGGYARDKDGKNAKAYKADITISPRPKGAFRANSITYPYKSNSLIYSACRALHIKVTNDNQPMLAAEASLVVADPIWLETMRFPNKGKVITGASCGADSVSEDYKLPGPVDYINSLMGAGKTIKDALDEKKKAGEKGSGTK